MEKLIYRDLRFHALTYGTRAIVYCTFPGDSNFASVNDFIDEVASPVAMIEAHTFRPEHQLKLEEITLLFASAPSVLGALRNYFDAVSGFIAETGWTEEELREEHPDLLDATTIVDELLGRFR